MKARITAVLLLLCLCVTALCGCNSEIPPAPTGNVGAEDVEMCVVNSADEVIPDGAVAVKNIAALHIPALEDTAEVYLENPAVNTDYYLIFELRLPVGEDYETLYTSKFVSPGTETPRIDLAHGLTAGEHDAVLVVTAYRIKDVTPVNNVELAVKLIVK